MLVLTRKEGSRILIGKDIVVTLVQIRGGKVRVGIEAPPAVDIVRDEIANQPERRSKSMQSAIHD